MQHLIRLLGESRRLSRAALHLLLLPHLQELSLRYCPSLVSNAIGQLITVRCTVSGAGRGRAHPPPSWAGLTLVSPPQPSPWRPPGTSPTWRCW